MAILKTDTKQVEIPDGSPLVKAAEELGVPFSCYTGICGICKIEVLEGAQNLSPLTQEETDQGMDQTHRLACQTKILSGTVKIKF